MFYYVLHVTQYIDFFFNFHTFRFQRVKKQEIMYFLRNYILATKTSYIIKTAAYILMHRQQAINNTSIA